MFWIACPESDHSVKIEISSGRNFILAGCSEGLGRQSYDAIGVKTTDALWIIVQLIGEN